MNSRRSVSPLSAGLFEWNKRTKEGVNKGVQYFQQAIEKNPNFAFAYVGLAYSYVVQQNHGDITTKDALAKSKPVIDRALALDESLGEAHLDLASLKDGFDWDWPGADFEVSRKGFQERDAAITSLAVDPLCDPLRSDPRFRDLLRRMNLPILAPPQPH